MTSENPDLTRLLQQLVTSARGRKERVRFRIQALKGDWLRTPSRGPIQKNGSKCIRWHFYEAARTNHKAVTRQITQLARLLP